MPADPRLSPGEHIHSIASRVLRSNAKKYFGTRNREKYLDGKVIEVTSKHVNGKNYKHLRFIFVYSSKVKICILPIGSIKDGLRSLLAGSHSMPVKTHTPS